jgi:GT2 family glycosyltransferase
MTDAARPGQSIRVRVVIPCRNEAGFIGPCLSSLIEADRSGMDVEVWVCDGMSEDGTRAEVQAISSVHTWIKMVENRARTTPQAMNLGLKPDGYDVGIILGAHAEVDPAFLRANIEVLAAHPVAGCAGGIIENVYADAIGRSIGAAMGHPFGVGGAHFRTGRKEGEVDTVAFGAYRREVFAQVGYFDERLVRNQDDELNYRVTKAGWKILLSPRIKSRYVVRASFSKLAKQYGQYGYWKVYVNRLHRTVTTMRQLVPAAFVLFIAIGAIAAVLFPALRWPYAIGLLLYAAVAIASAVHAADRRPDIPRVLAAFMILHFAYGTGYLRGAWDFILFGRGPKGSASTSSR